jgi:hypothetical protein
MSDEKAQTIKDLRAVADLIEANGLTKNKFYDASGDGADPKDCPVCSLGGINVTVWGHPEGSDVVYWELSDEEFEIRGGRYTAARAALVAHLGIKTYGIPRWNDEPERSREEVVSAFRAAADALEASK